MTRTGCFRYVVWDDVERYLAAGWIQGIPVSDYSTIMWACECNPEGVRP